MSQLLSLKVNAANEYSVVLGPLAARVENDHAGALDATAYLRIVPFSRCSTPLIE